MDVIGVGFGRTGTLSLKIALERLGYGPCLHMLSLFDDPGRAALFRRAAGGDPDALGAAVTGFRSSVDWPGAYFWRELVEEHPAAKVVLTVRDPQRWYASVEQTILRAATDPGAPENESLQENESLAMIRATVWEGTFGGRLGDREHAVRVFTDHLAAVRREVPADRLLEFEVSQGWGPLARFLDRPVPGEAFPRVNDTAEFQARLAHLPTR